MDPIWIEFIGILQNKMGRRNYNVMVDAPITVYTLIKRTISDFDLTEAFLMNTESGSLEQKALIFVNGKEISVLNGLETRLGGGDKVTIISVSHGG
jgi:molybdopterin converting factor small subunit